MVKAAIAILAFGLWAFAQGEEPKLVVNLDGFRYPPIARQARIQGDVVFRVTQNGRELVFSANPLLRPAAENNLNMWPLPPIEEGTYIITYHFVILNWEARSVPTGNK